MSYFFNTLSCRAVGVCFPLRLWTLPGVLCGAVRVCCCDRAVCRAVGVGASAVGGVDVCRAGCVARPGVLLGVLVASPPGLVADRVRLLVAVLWLFAGLWRCVSMLYI